LKIGTPNLFRQLGYVAIGLGIALALLFVLNVRSRVLYGGPNYSPLVWMGTYSVAIGIGLAHLRRWAVALFVLTTLSIGLFVIVRAVIETPLPWTLLNIALGIVFCLPVVPAIHCSSELK
jgi:hypothetical protein